MSESFGEAMDKLLTSTGPTQEEMQQVKEDHLAMSNPRDTQFAGFAKLLLEDMMATNAMDIVDAERFLRACDREELLRLFARHAYVFACHTISSQSQGLDLLCNHDPEWIRERVELVPDMFEWPKEEL